MKIYPRLLIWSLVSGLWSLSSCASTTFFRDGKPIVKFEGDMEGVAFHGLPTGEITWTAARISHSAATAAAGKVASDVLLYSAPVITATGLPRLIK